MFPEPITVIISPHSSSNQLVLKLTRPVLSIIFTAFLLLVIIISAYFGYHLYKYLLLGELLGPTQSRICKLENENRELKLSLNNTRESEKRAREKMLKERKNFAEKMSNFETKLKQLEKFYNDLRIMAGFKLNEDEAKDLGKVEFKEEGAMLGSETGEGVGGVPERGMEYLQVLLSNDKIDKVFFKKSHEWELKLMEETKKAFDNMQLMKRLLEERASTLDDTPSLMPVIGPITSPFGVKRGRGTHTGIDIGAIMGTPVRAPADGVVIKAGSARYYGKLIILDHGNGYTTRFAHLSKIDVSIGDRVSEGDIIGRVGSTGWSTGSHLHYEVRFNSVPLDPINYMKYSEPEKREKEVYTVESGIEKEDKEDEMLNDTDDSDSVLEDDGKRDDIQ